MRQARPPRATERRPRSENIEINKRIVAASSAEHILRLYDREGRSFNTVNTATAIHRLGKCKDRPRTSDPRLRSLLELAARSIDGHPELWDPRSLANVCWGAAKAGASSRALFGAVAHVARSRLGQFNSQDLANTAWAFATAGVSSRALFEAIAAEARARIGQF
ncbi:MAG: hypothetical protein ACO33E_07155, partial [Aquiluna sp.]